MTLAALLGFLALVGLAAYAQTLTGFAFGLISMGGIALSGLMPLPQAAAVVSLLTLVNASQMLLKGWRDVAWPEFRLVMLASLPLLLVGYGLLVVLAGRNLDLLRLILGLVIMASSLQLLSKPAPLARTSGPASFLFFGAIAGLMGGLFSTGGPPLVYHFYRQPIPLVRIRETLVSVFALNAVLRIALVAWSGDPPLANLWPALPAIPAVMALTHAARRWPPPISPAQLRRLVFTLLFASGLSLALPALAHWLG